MISVQLKHVYDQQLIDNLGGYGVDLSRKQWLLDHERINSTKEVPL
ncbi:Uncharacterised protein [Actinobacillus pleuropneumoniae]|jgi:hypothetical protein|uniref:MGMT family protein n=1 Tax=Paenibacillus lautus TaxID=1401 RepID=A0A385TLD0_PAELA|nr:MGMT family protein [Paenibacillus lautus]VTR37942.1 Uncharacterised protein [Actinobacillus pleuropneumoniae]